MHLIELLIKLCAAQCMEPYICHETVFITDALANMAPNFITVT